ncbi:MAG: LacI family DNA-binding transcriptional regulator [Eubacteriaceae bacterium]
MAATIQQIADIAGVSRGTVDRAINDRGRVNPEVREKILTIAREIGYKPKHPRGAAVLQDRGRKIGVITQLKGSSFMNNINQGIHDAGELLDKLNIKLVIRENEGVDADQQIRALDELAQQDIDALAIMPADDERVRARLNELADEKQIPVVTFNADLAGSGRRCFIGLDNIQSGRTAAGLMAMMLQGKGKVLAITGYFSNSVNSERIDGFTDELRKSYPEISLIGVHSSFDRKEEVEKIIVNNMTMFPDLSGILIGSAGQAGVKAALDKLKPEKRPCIIIYDITRTNIGILDDGYVDFLIDQDGYSQGYQACKMLADILRENSEPESDRLYTEIRIKTKYNISREEAERVGAPESHDTAG